MTPSLEPPPDRVRTPAAPVDRRHGTSQDFLCLLGAADNDATRERVLGFARGDVLAHAGACTTPGAELQHASAKN
jgi:hypothetical protein